MRRLLALVAVAALLVGCTSSRDTTAPEITGELLDGGGTYRLADHRGEVVVVNFWASWCAPCRAEIDDLEETYQATKDDGVSFVGIDIRDPDRDKARAFVEGRTSYPNVYDPAGKISVAFSGFGATTIPATVIVDRNGKVAHVLREPVRRPELEPLIDAVAAQPRP